MGKGALFFLLWCGSVRVWGFTTTPFQARNKPQRPAQRSSLGAFALDIPSAASAIDDFFLYAPVQSAFLTCGFKASVADAVAQKIDSSSDEDNVESIGDSTKENQAFSPARNLAYIAYGSLYTGISCHFIYNVWFPLIFGTAITPITVFKEVALDSLVIGPCVCLPVAYLVKAVVFDYSISEALSKYADDVRLNGLLIKYWSLWLPVQALTFSVVPEHLRVFFMACVSFFWFIVLSLASDNDAALEDAQV